MDPNPTTAARIRALEQERDAYVRDIRRLPWLAVLLAGAVPAGIYGGVVGVVLALGGVATTIGVAAYILIARRIWAEQEIRELRGEEAPR